MANPSSPPAQPMVDTIRGFIDLNRTIVSSDNLVMLQSLQKTYLFDLESFPSGSEYETWLIPPAWNVRRAQLSDGSEIIASYAESPLFVAPYSQSFAGWITRAELESHTLSNPQVPDAFSYEFRLAYDYQRRLREWRLSIPHNRLLELGDGPFYVDIEIDSEPGEMHVGVASHPGQSGHWFTFLAHYCHVGQANDGLAGVIIMLETFKRLRERFRNPVHGYRVLLFPETIGSATYAAVHEDELDATLGAVFSEMGGAQSPLQLVMSRRGSTYIDRVFRYALRESGKTLGRIVPFRSGWGNDELVFDAPGLGVPALSLDRYPFEPYHTSEDDIESVDEGQLNEVVDILLSVVELLEIDFIPRPKSRVPIYLTRFGLYADWTTERQEYDMRAAVMDNMHAGLSVLDIALKNHLNFRDVHRYVRELRLLGLVASEPVTPAYARNVQFTHSFDEV